MDISTWQVYILIAIILMAAEIFVPSLILLPIGLGFLISAIFASFTTNDALLYLETAVCIAIVFFGFRRVFHGTSKPPVPTAVDAMIGKEVIVLEKVTHSVAGNVKLYGDTWKALAVEPGQEFQQDDIAIISKVEGNKVFLIEQQ